MNWLIFCHDFKDYLNLFKNFKNKKIISNHFFFIKKKDDLEKIKRNFKNSYVYFQEFSNSIPEFEDYILDDSTIKKFIESEILFYQSIDYYEFPGNYFSSKDLRSTYYYYINNIILFIKKNKIKNIFFTHTPHTLVEILFLSVAKNLNVKTIFRRGLSIPDFYTYESEIYDYKFKFNKRFKQNKISKNLKYFKKNYSKKFNLINSPKSKWLDYSLIKNYKKFNNLINVVFTYFNLIFTVRFLYRLLGVTLKSLYYLTFFYKKKNIFFKYFFLEDTLPKYDKIFYKSKSSRFYFEKIIFNGHIQKNKLLKIYFNLSKKPNIKNKYIFFPLWFQPSSTLHPFAGRMVDYEIAIKMLSRSSPKDFKIYVKESPDIFNLASRSWFKGHFTRREKFYTEISNLHNVELINYDIDDSLLVDNSSALATLCDKFNLIALVKKKPNICFSETITSGFKNTFICKNKKNINIFFKKLRQGDFEIDDLEVKNYFIWLSDNSFFSKLNLGFNNYEPKQNYKKTSFLLERIIKKVVNE